MEASYGGHITVVQALLADARVDASIQDKACSCRFALVASHTQYRMGKPRWTGRSKRRRLILSHCCRLKKAVEASVVFRPVIGRVERSTPTFRVLKRHGHVRQLFISVSPRRHANCFSKEATAHASLLPPPQRTRAHSNDRNR